MELPPLPQDFLYYAESPIHGLGIFTKFLIPTGYELGRFEGIEYHITEFIKKYGSDYQYCYRMLPVHKVICAKENRNWITYLNDGVYKQVDPKRNVILKSRKAFAHTDIQPNEELLLDYGRNYPWKKSESK